MNENAIHPKFRTAIHTAPPHFIHKLLHDAQCSELFSHRGSLKVHSIGDARGTLHQLPLKEDKGVLLCLCLG